MAAGAQSGLKCEQFVTLIFAKFQWFFIIFSVYKLLPEHSSWSFYPRCTTKIERSKITAKSEEADYRKCRIMMY